MMISKLMCSCVFAREYIVLHGELCCHRNDLLCVEWDVKPFSLTMGN